MDSRVLAAAAIFQLIAIGFINGEGLSAIQNRLASRICDSYAEFLVSKQPSGKVKPAGGQNIPYCWQRGCAPGGSCDPPKWELRSCGKPKDSGSSVATRTLHGGGEKEVKVVGGNNAIPHGSPYMIFLFNYEKTKVIGHGFLFDRYTVIMDNFPLLYNFSDPTKLQNYRLIAGAHDRFEIETEREMRQICDFTVHPQQTADPRTNSYGIVHLFDPFTFTNAVKEAKMRNHDHDKDPDSLHCKFAGWGADESGAWMHILQEKAIDIDYSTKTCEPTATEFCGTKGLCYQDFGSPLMCSYQSRLWVFGMGSFNKHQMDATCVGSTSGYSSFSDMRKADLIRWIELDIEAKKSKCRTQYDYKYE